MKKSFLKYFDSISEGIDVDKENLLISFNPTHEEFVNTSLNGNPTVDNSMIPGVPVWSIFKRKYVRDTSDGNPLVYALKNERGWRFKSLKDKDAIIKQFNSIADKFLKTHSYNVTLVVPSSNSLNDYLANSILSKDSNIEKIDGGICKMTTSDIYEIVMDKNSKFRKVYSGKGEFLPALRLLERYLREMNETRGGNFTRHLIRDRKMREAVDFTLKRSPDYVADDANKINGSDVLVIDDVISHGQSIKEMVNLIKSSYAPKSITVLTLLSKLN